jgi:colanic acid biosynthesis protein WcaH
VIPAQQYQQIIEVLPILCVDVVITNPRGEYLLIKRANQPRQGEWWVIGGRLLKGETLEEAAVRKVWEETSLDVQSVHPIGYYEAASQENPFGLAPRLHAVSVVFLTVVDDHQPIRLDDQSSDWKFSKELPADFHVKSFGGGQPTKQTG